jgi:hypothetical protein
MDLQHIESREGHFHTDAMITSNRLRYTNRKPKPLEKAQRTTEESENNSQSTTHQHQYGRNKEEKLTPKRKKNEASHF